MTIEKQEKKVKIKENKEISDFKVKLEEYTADLKRLQAEYENYIKRTEKEKQEFTKYSSHKILNKIVNLYDDFERALEVIKTIENKELKDGIEMIHKQFTNLLNEEGVKKIECKGNKFDPYKHEILDITEGSEDNLVVDELQPGYLIHDKVLKTAKVRISKIKEEQKNV